MSGEVQLVVDARSSDLRRRIGPNAWVVLEELLLGASPEGALRNVVVTRATVRALADRTALSKDTVSRAIQKLRRARLVDIEPERHDDSGRFVSVRYLVDLTRMPIAVRVLPERLAVAPAAVVPSVAQAGPAAAAPLGTSPLRPPARRPVAKPGAVEQLSMLG